LQLLGVELAEPAEVGDVGILADADQGDPARRDAELAEGGEDLGELELVVEVGLEPQQVLAVAALGQRPVAMLQPAKQLGTVGEVLAGEEVRPDAPQLAVADRGTGPSCRASRHGRMRAARSVRRRMPAALSPLVTCSAAA